MTEEEETLKERALTTKLAQKVLNGNPDPRGYPYSLDSVDELAHELMLASETPTTTSLLMKGDVGYSARTMPSTLTVYRHWCVDLVRLNKFDSVFELVEANFSLCWGCGMYSEYGLQRAHILPRSYGGTDDASNLHMLCSKCHKISESTFGAIYRDWFINSSSFGVHPLAFRWLYSRDPEMLTRYAAEFSAEHVALMREVIEGKVIMYQDFQDRLKRLN